MSGQSTDSDQAHRKEVRDGDPQVLLGRRRAYLALLILLAISLIAAVLVAIAGYVGLAEICFLASYVFAAFFLSRFLNVVRKTLGYSTFTLACLLIVVLLIPFINLLIVAIVDRQVLDAIRQKDARSHGHEPPTISLAKPELSSLAVFSLVLCPLPYIGLPMAIWGVRKISRSDGRLYGRTLAWVSVVANSAVLLLMLTAVAQMSCR